MKKNTCSVGLCGRRAVTEVYVEPTRYIRPHFRKRCEKHARLKGLSAKMQANLASILRTPIAETSLRSATKSALLRRFQTIGCLVRVSEVDVLFLPPIGVKRLSEVAKLLDSEGLNYDMKFKATKYGVDVVDWGKPPKAAGL